MAWGKTENKEETPKDVSTIFTPVVDLEEITALKLGVYGKAKVGKTHFCLTAKRPVYIIDTEGSIKINVKQLPKEEREGIFVAEVLQAADKKDKEIDLVKSLDALVEAIDTITDAVIKQEESGSNPGTIVIDSATDIWDWLSIWLDEAATRTKAGDMPRFEWGKANKKYTEVMYMLLRSNWNVVMTFRAKEVVNSKGESLGTYGPRWQKNTDYWLDLITEMQRDGLSHVMRFRGGRYGDVIPDLKEPTWEKLRKHISDNTGVTFR